MSKYSSEEKRPKPGIEIRGPFSIFGSSLDNTTQFRDVYAKYLQNVNEPRPLDHIVGNHPSMIEAFILNAVDEAKRTTRISDLCRHYLNISALYAELARQKNALEELHIAQAHFHSPRWVERVKNARID